MAFTLHVGEPFQARVHDDQSVSTLIDETRRGLRARKASWSAEIPKAQAVLVVGVFLLGLSLANLRPYQFHQNDSFDMTPTGTILKKAPASLAKGKACD